MNKSFLRGVLAIFLPVLLIFLWWLRIHSVVANGNEIALGVSGYDPRDLLSGHYLTYQVTYSPVEPCPDRKKDSERCVCFADQGSETEWSGSCNELPHESCRKYLRGSCRYGRFEAGIEKYFIPESYASTNPIPPNSYIVVALDGRGGGIVKDFFVEGTKLLNWLKAQPTPTPK